MRIAKHRAKSKTRTRRKRVAIDKVVTVGWLRYQLVCGEVHAIPLLARRGKGRNPHNWRAIESLQNRAKNGLFTAGQFQTWIREAGAIKGISYARTLTMDLWRFAKTLDRTWPAANTPGGIWRLVNKSRNAKSRISLADLANRPRSIQEWYRGLQAGYDIVDLSQVTGRARRRVFKSLCNVIGKIRLALRERYGGRMANHPDTIVMAVNAINSHYHIVPDDVWRMPLPKFCDKLAKLS